MLQQFVLPAFGSEYGHLRAKACWMAGQFADVKFKDGTGRGVTFNTLFSFTVKALQDPDLPVGPSPSSLPAMNSLCPRPFAAESQTPLLRP